MRRPKKAQAETITGGTSVEVKTPEWVRAMHAHFNETGTYRAEDIHESRRPKKVR